MPLAAARWTALALAAATTGTASCRDQRPVPATRTPAAASAARVVDTDALAEFRRAYRSRNDSAIALFRTFLPVVGATPLLDFLEATYPACHSEAHELGRAIYQVTGDVETSLGQCDTRCTSGCMHGVVTAALGGSTPETIAARMDAFCSEGGMAAMHKAGNCAHGLGHALMFATDGNVRRSIDGCLGFAGEAMQYYCGTGVFMESFERDSAQRLSRSALGPCDQEALFPAACYRYKGFLMLAAVGEDSVKRQCAALDGLQRHGCFHGLGYAAISGIIGDPARLPDVCDSESRDDRIVCIEGVIEKLADLHPGRARAACSYLAEDLQPVCSQAAARKMYGVEKATFSLYYDEGAIARRRAAIAVSRERRESSPHQH